MPSLDATLAWAVQVDVEVLGAHLEAYANTLPTVNALRLCNRFGKGLHAAIARLPPELVGIIEDILIYEQRCKLFAQWTTDFRCYHLMCAPVDHVAKEQFPEYLRRAEADGDFDYPPIFELPSEDDEKDHVDAYLAGEIDDWCETHWGRGYSWQDRVGMQTGDRRGIFTEHETLIKKHFGLEVWTSHVRLESVPYENYWDGDELEVPHTTVAYLKLPGASRHVRCPALTEDERSSKEFFIESGYGMPVHIPPPLSHSATNRFKRMMQILDLKPYSEPSQMDLDLYADGETTAAKEFRKKVEDDDTTTAPSPSSEPKLTMLVRHTVRSDEYE